MNYYERHLGDYARDTGHLTQAEHGAYNLLMDRYYVTEEPIPAAIVYRIAKAATRPERAAVDVVLREFFTLVDGAWVKGRIEQEIARAQAKIRAAQENGKTGGRPKKQAGEKPAGFCGDSESEAHQTPATSLQPVVTEEREPHTEPSSDVAPGVGEVDRRTAGAICRRLIELGIEPTTCNPAHPLLGALLHAGAAVHEFDGAARAALAKNNKTFAYVLGIVKRQREDAANLTLHQGALPGARHKPWFLSSSGIEAKARELNVVQDHDESFPAFKGRVFVAAGVTRDMVRAAEIDFGARA